MTKEHIQEAAERFALESSDCCKAWNQHCHDCDCSAYEEGFVKGVKYILTSDLVKGLVEALEQVLNGTEDFKEDTAISSVRSGVIAALTNYKQEIKTLNEKQ